MNFISQKKYSLVVSTSDNYECAWYPYFELIKIYWKNCPEIYLNSETKKYFDEKLNINNICGGKEISWSERLWRCLNQIPSEYIIFSLEDFFLIDYVKDDVINKCIKWMDENKNIAEFRLKPYSNKKLIYSEKYFPFRIANNDIPFRLDTQVAIWRKSDLMSFLDFKEDPWHFEGDGTKRIFNSQKMFLWMFLEDENDVKNFIFPYHINQSLGFGIAWGRWLWNNKPLFEKNNIKKVNYRCLGVLSEKSVKRRFRFLYRSGLGPAKGFEKLIQKIYKFIDTIEKGFILIKINGFKKGMQEIKRKRKKQHQN